MNYVELLESTSQQGSAPKRAELYNPESECKQGLLVVKVTAKGFEKPWIVLIEFEACENYVRRSSLGGSQLYADAIKSQRGDTVTVRLATGKRVTVPKVLVGLKLEYLDFDSVERCTVLDGTTSSEVWHG